jgi:hypothetical protein
MLWAILPQALKKRIVGENPDTKDCVNLSPPFHIELHM